MHDFNLLRQDTFPDAIHSLVAIAVDPKAQAVGADPPDVLLQANVAYGRRAIPAIIPTARSNRNDNGKQQKRDQKTA
ncbi:MAG: hypothetical protein NTW20_08140 [Rhodobacterales bacterium]|nr:hypothetical protein [Rhodobacterales bacterium]